ncbi:MAG: cytochrome c [Pseudomonadota bacterium]
MNRFIRQPIVAATLFAIGVVLGTAIASASDVVEERTAAMDTIRFGLSKAVPMIKGERPFDPELAEAALRMTYTGALAFQGKFPEGSVHKGANPAIWVNKADFEAKVVDFIKAAKAGVDAKPQTVEAFKVAYDELLADCASCHKLYRIKDK